MIIKVMIIKVMIKDNKIDREENKIDREDNKR